MGRCRYNRECGYNRERLYRLSSPSSTTTPTPPPSPAEQITDIVVFLDAAVKAGDLPKDQPLKKTLDQAAQSIAAGNTAKSCSQLQSAYDRNKKELRSKDPDVRTAAIELAQQLQGLMNDLGCQ